MGDKRSLIVPGFGIEKIQQLKIDLKSPHGMKQNMTRMFYFLRVHCVILS